METGKAIIIGASSGIGNGLALLLAEKGYKVGITGRREGLLQSMAEKHPGKIIARSFDVCDLGTNLSHIDELINELGGLDLLVYSSGCGFINKDLKWGPEVKTVETNVSGFVQIVAHVFNYFRKHEKEGHIVNISSLAAYRGSANAPAYNASKAFQSNYMEGLRVKAHGLSPRIWTTDVKPGFVDTPMAIGSGLFWVAPVEKACLQIYSAIMRKKRYVYITKRWKFIAWFLKLLPDFMYDRMK